MMTQTTVVYTVIAVFCSVLLTDASASSRKRSTQSAVEKSIGGVVGHPVHLHCSLSMSSPPSIQWFDKVFNEGEDPQLIYSSSGNGQVASDHPNQKNLAIGTDFSLTISHLEIGRDGGEYFCRSTLADGVEHEISYQLTVFEPPRCSNVTHFMNGQQMALDCQLGFGGSQPTINWYRTVTNGHMHDNQETDNSDHHHRHHQPELISSIDMFDILDTPVARKVVQHKAHPVDDGATYRCRVTVGDLTKECHLKVSVTYSVRDLHILPKGETVHVGETVVCSAKGNPVPDVELKVYLKRDSKLVAGSEVTSSGSGSQKFVVEAQHKDGTLHVECSASNTIIVDNNPVTERISSNHTYHVTVPIVTTIATTTKSHHQQHHSNPADHNHMSHHSHPPQTNGQQQQQPKAIVSADTEGSQGTSSRKGSSASQNAATSTTMTLLILMFVALVIN